MAKREILGYIACPVCGSEMRITADKNGEPFGYCETDCNLQMRIGGSSYRVGKFLARYPWAKPGAAPVSVTDTAPAPPKKNDAPIPKAPPPVTDAAPKPAPKPAGGSVFDQLFRAGGGQ